MWKTRWMAIVWTAFLAACLMEVLVFAVVDPLEMEWVQQNIAWSRDIIYTLVFFIFWLVFSVAGYLTILLSLPKEELDESVQQPWQV